MMTKKVENRDIHVKQSPEKLRQATRFMNFILRAIFFSFLAAERSLREISGQIAVLLININRQGRTQYVAIYCSLLFSSSITRR